MDEDILDPSGPTCRPRILYIQQPTGGGTMTGLIDLLRALDTDRYRPEVLLYSDSRYRDELDSVGARIRVLGGEKSAKPLPQSAKKMASGLKRFPLVNHLNRLLRRDLRLALRIAKVIRAVDPDIVHHNDNPRGDRASILAAALTGATQISHVRYIPEKLSPVDPLLARTVTGFIYMSEAIRGTVGERLGIGDGRGQVIYDPFNFDRFRPDPDARTEVRTEFGFESDSHLVTNVGRLVEWKGQDVFLRAAASVLSTQRDVRFLIVGDDASDFASALKILARKLGVADRVVFTGTRSDVPRLMAASDVVVHSSTRPEPFGRVVVEAMACGRPVVSVAAGGPLEIVDDERTGRLVAPGDPAEMAEAVLDLLRNPRKATRMGGRARSAAERRFGEEQFARSIHGLYERVMRDERPWG